MDIINKHKLCPTEKLIIVYIKYLKLSEEDRSMVTLSEIITNLNIDFSYLYKCVIKLENKQILHTIKIDKQKHILI